MGGDMGEITLALAFVALWMACTFADVCRIAMTRWAGLIEMRGLERPNVSELSVLYSKN